MSWLNLGHGVRLSVIKMGYGYWGLGFDKAPSQLTIRLFPITIDIFWGYAK